jgi:signal transduction histidine kinase
VGDDGGAGAGRERALRTELRGAERRAAFLAEASSILVATSSDFDATLLALARLAASRLCDWCVIHSLDESGAFVRAAVCHNDPRLDQALARLIDTSLNERWRRTVRSVASTQQSQIQARLEPDTWFDTGAADSELLDDLARGSAMITPLTGRGDVLGAITFVATRAEQPFDENALSLAEELGRRAAIALDNARLYRQARDANRVKADFLAVMSHELRTPLNAIMGYTDLLDAGVSGELSDQQHHQLDRIRTSARHLLQLIEEILSFARMEAGAEEVQFEEVAVHHLVEEIATTVEPLATAKNLELEVAVSEPGITLRTDPAKLRQILMNLLSNAVKFTEKGKVVLGVRNDEGRTHFDIVDTGIGIPDDQLNRIFDPFWQLERPNTRRAGGTGLGLSVSRRYTRLPRGNMAVDSKAGEGTHVTVSLPTQ